MNGRKDYYDIRADLWRKHFERAKPYADYLEESDPIHASKWLSLSDLLPPLTGDEKNRLRGHNRRVNVLVYSGIWCGDCARQVPMVQRIAEAVGPEMELRIVEREESEELCDELRILGAMRVPVMVFLSEDFHEAGRFGDRMLVAYRRKLRDTMGEVCDTGLVPAPKEELAAEQTEWVHIVERMLLMMRLSPPLMSRYGV